MDRRGFHDRTGGPTGLAVRPQPGVSRFAIVCLTLLLAAGRAKLLAKDTTSGDGYVRFDERTSTWTQGTAMVEQRFQLGKGVFARTCPEK